MLVTNMLLTNTGERYAIGTMVDAGRDLPLGGRGEPGPDDLEHRAAGHLGRAAREHRRPAVAGGRLLARVRRGHGAGRDDRGPYRPQAAAADRAGGVPGRLAVVR